MEMFRAIELVLVTRIFSKVAAEAEQGGTQVLSPETRASMRGEPQGENLARFGFSVTGTLFDEILDLADSPTATYATFAELSRGLLRAYEAECGNITLAYLGPKQVALYDAVEPFGEEVAKAFSKAAYDIEEAAKCLALERFTASVYHLMRVAEAGLKTVAKRVGLVNDVPGWDECITYIEGQVTKNYAEMNALFKGDVEFLTGIASHMRDVNMAWRRRVAHIEKEYSEADARRIWETTKNLMQHIATKLAEIDSP